LDEYNKLSISGINFHEAKEAIHHDITAARAAISAIVSKDPETTSRVQNALGSLESAEKNIRTGDDPVSASQTGNVSRNLPKSWVLGFFAALSAVLGHFIYQMRAPDVIRRYTIDEYARQSRDDYVQFPSPEKLNRALRILIDYEEFRGFNTPDPENFDSDRRVNTRELMNEHARNIPYAAFEPAARDRLGQLDE
jgi:hypothetical protein